MRTKPTRQNGTNLVLILSLSSLCCVIEKVHRGEKRQCKISEDAGFGMLLPPQQQYHPVGEDKTPVYQVTVTHSIMPLPFTTTTHHHDDSASIFRPCTSRRRGSRVAGWQFWASPSILSTAGIEEVLSQSKQAGQHQSINQSIKQTNTRKHASPSTGYRHGKMQRLEQPSPPAPKTAAAGHPSLCRPAPQQHVPLPPRA